MTTVALVSQKGGAGKTTLAIHLGAIAATEGFETCIIDTDQQATAATWGQWRKEMPPEVITSPPPLLATKVKAAHDLGAQLVIIDTPPQADAAARAAVKVADLVLIPARPRAFDLHAIQTTAELVADHTHKAFVIFNATPPRAPNLLADAAGVIREYGLQVCPITIADRGSFHHGVADGKVAYEIDRYGKAAQEISSLWQWVREQVNV